MKRSIVIALLTIATFSVGWYVGSDSVYFKINRSLEVFGSVFREISENYVDEVEPEEFVRSGIDGMLGTLDPYTEYLDQTRSEDFDALTTGQYTGFGIVVGTRDSMLTISAISEGYSAQRSGLRIGDRIYSIDSTVLLNANSKDLKRFTRGEPGSKAVMRVLRDGLSDTLRFTLTRERIMVKSVSYIGKTANNVGVIKLDRFARRSAEEVRDALDSLRSMGNLNGIILDLRDNPGGLLDAAVSICEAFVPYGSKIVSTKGRNLTETKVYASNTYPYEGSLPLAVLVNKSSASASEIVAGCIQDLDRGIVVGESSFGKGLVQTVFPLPYNTNLKITTAKYYTPSGRCIQKIDYTKKRLGIKTPDSTKLTFYTLNRRPVKEGNGISPDTTMREDENIAFLNQLKERDVLFRFANEYAAAKSALPQSYNPVALVDDAEKFAQKRKFAFDNPALKKLADAKKSLSDEKFSAEVMKLLDETEKNVKVEQTRMFKQHSKQIARMLDDEIRARFYTESLMTEHKIKNDDVVKKTADMLLTEGYRSLLRTPVAMREGNR